MIGLQPFVAGQTGKFAGLFRQLGEWFLVRISNNRCHKTIRNGYGYSDMYITMHTNGVTKPGAVHIGVLAESCSAGFYDHVVEADLNVADLIELSTG